ncbi:hypothetical protein [Fundidesulfovibrio magnetotacticus]|uniref:hypothetical protein n=1 Tax=Fundidesulfovibrio magnetotacticus TaxID=2730080 RepID=UPI001563495E|nr:hypothetical protein [Fundidesulfovibrio magnetotacticus]
MSRAGRLLERGWARCERGNRIGALDCFQDAARIPDAAPAERAEALHAQGAMLDALGMDGEALDAFEELARDYLDSLDETIAARVDAALGDSVVLLAGQGRAREALDLSDRLLKRLEGSGRPGAAADEAAALCNRGTLLLKLGREREAARCFARAARRASLAGDADGLLHGARARNALGFVLLMRAKPRAASRRKRRGLGAALRLLGQALDFHDDPPTVQGNQAYALFLLGRAGEARAPLSEALRVDGERVYACEVQDASGRSIPEDADFLRFLADTWREVQGTEPPAL